MLQVSFRFSLHFALHQNKLNLVEAGFVYGIEAKIF